MCVPKFKGVNLIQTLLQGLNKLDVRQPRQVRHVLVKCTISKWVPNIAVGQVAFKEGLLHIVEVVVVFAITFKVINFVNRNPTVNLFRCLIDKTVPTSSIT